MAPQRRKKTKTERSKDAGVLSAIADGLAEYFSNLPVPVPGVEMTPEQRVVAYGAHNGVPSMTPGEYRDGSSIKPVPGSVEALTRWVQNGIEHGEWDKKELVKIGLDTFVAQNLYSYLRSDPNSPVNLIKDTVYKSASDPGAALLQKITNTLGIQLPHAPPPPPPEPKKESFWQKWFGSDSTETKQVDKQWKKTDNGYKFF